MPITRFHSFSTPLLLGVSLFLVPACTETPSSVPNDASVVSDTGTGFMLDSGIGTPVDGGQPFDSGPMKVDGGTKITDAGEVPADRIPSCTTDLSGQLTNLRVPGLAAGIVKGGRLVCVAVAGNASIEDNRPVTEDTVFAWASVSKTVTAAAVMTLVDDGLVGLDDDVNDHLPFPVRNPECPADPITIRQLLTHSSSIIDGDVYDTTYTIGDSPIALGDFIRGYVEPGGTYYDADQNFDYECPGQYVEYSNVAIAVLGHLVEVVARMPFDQFCSSRIFAALGMSDASFLLAGVDVDNVAMPYNGNSPATFTANGHVGFPTLADGSLRTSVPDLARFLAMMTTNGEFQGARILAGATVQEMFRVQRPALDDVQALVWYYEDYGTRTSLVGHNGSDPGTSAIMFLDPSDGAGVLLVANGDWYNASDESPEADALLAALFDEANAY